MSSLPMVKINEWSKVIGLKLCPKDESYAKCVSTGSRAPEPLIARQRKVHSSAKVMVFILDSESVI